jgi:hypothetical protein
MTARRFAGEGSFGLQATALDEVQGKCRICRIRWHWPKKAGLLRGALCPKCGGPVRRTTHLLQGYEPRWVQKIAHVSSLRS